jgi:transcriptional regulator with XRE-family HTH domain
MSADSLKRNSETEGPDPIDIHVGTRLRKRRTIMGMTQEQLGKAAGLTFQQIQKYERGANRMGASRLYHLARLLNVSVSYFFEKMPPELSGISNVGLNELEQAGLDEAPVQNDNELLKERDAMAILRAYRGIIDPKKRRTALDVIKGLAEDKSK